MSDSVGIPGTNVHQSQYETTLKTLSLCCLLSSVFFMVGLWCDAPTYYGQLKMIHGIKSDTIDILSIFRLQSSPSISLALLAILDERSRDVGTVHFLTTWRNNIYIISFVWPSNKRDRYKFEWIIQFHWPKYFDPMDDLI